MDNEYVKVKGNVICTTDTMRGLRFMFEVHGIDLNVMDYDAYGTTKIGYVAGRVNESEGKYVDQAGHTGVDRINIDEIGWFDMKTDWDECGLIAVGVHKDDLKEYEERESEYHRMTFGDVAG